VPGAAARDPEPLRERRVADGNWLVAGDMLNDQARSSVHVPAQLRMASKFSMTSDRARSAGWVLLGQSRCPAWRFETRDFQRAARE
jgi:hypothetical protein